jgi:hypothetical protein
MRSSAVALLVLTCAFTTEAAEVTRVASSFEEKDPFGMYLDFTFDRLQEKGLINREWHQNGVLSDVSELRYSHTQTDFGIDAHIGIFRDLELHVGVPIVFQDDRAWGFAKGTDANNTTLSRNCSDARGTLCSTPGQATGVLFPVGDGINSYRSGLGDFVFGLKWAPFNQKKDDTKPTWTLRFDYTAPTASLLDPSVTTSSSSRGNIGEHVHKFTFATAVSKRLGAAEPYATFDYTLPWQASGIYSNCDTGTDANMARLENCSQGPWLRTETGIKPAHTGNVAFGSELTVFERPERYQRVLFDLGAHFGYTSEGRYYNELSDPMGKLLYSTDYGTVGGHVGFIGQAAEFVILRAYASFSYNTEHFLTNEAIGKDLDNSGVVEVTTQPLEVNPNYDFRVDRVGYRFRIEEQFLFRIQVTATFNF